MNLDLKSMVIDQKKVKFSFYRMGELWYVTECGFEFPVPISDTGTGVFPVSDKAILYMRWIRPHIERIKEGMKECNV